MSLHYLLVSIVSDKSWLSFWQGVCMCFPPLGAFKIVLKKSLSFSSLTMIYLSMFFFVFILLEISCTFKICGFLFVAKFGKILANIPSNIFFCPSLPLLLSPAPTSFFSPPSLPPSLIKAKYDYEPFLATVLCSGKAPGTRDLASNHVSVEP